MRSCYPRVRKNVVDRAKGRERELEEVLRNGICMQHILER